jgi:hypothetical protein
LCLAADGSECSIAEEELLPAKGAQERDKNRYLKEIISKYIGLCTGGYVRPLTRRPVGVGGVEVPIRTEASAEEHTNKQSVTRIDKPVCTCVMMTAIQLKYNRRKSMKSNIRVPCEEACSGCSI